jgi:hypothetical protein
MLAPALTLALEASAVTRTSSGKFIAVSRSSHAGGATLWGNAERGQAAPRTRVLAWLLLACTFSVVQAGWLLAPEPASSQLLVHPRRPGQTNVRYADFDWRYVDLLTHERLKLDIEWQRGPRFHSSAYRPPALGTPWAWPSLDAAALTQPSASTGQLAAAGQTKAANGERSAQSALQTAGGIRLYFYERERSIAERAAASIEASYRYLAAEFGYAPRKTFAYFLYSSYIEFLQTELFPLQEGVLGVTSTEGLELTLPYFGDHRMFEDVSTHELAHEFSLQKLLTVAHEAELPDAPLEHIPIWFMEGLAEYYAKRGLDAEAEVLVRDLLINPAQDGYVLGDFFEDRLGDGLWTYKVGQARCAFLEETYGKGTIQRIIEATPRLAKASSSGGVNGFRALIGQITQDRPARLSARFERWIKRRAYRAYLETSQDRVDMAVLTQVDGLVQTLSASPSGQLLLYRSVDRDTGATSLYLLDRHSASDAVEVARDGRPGVESLHPVAGRNFDLTDHVLAYVAQTGGRDVLYIQSFLNDVVPQPCGESGEQAAKVCHWDVEIELGTRRSIAVGERGVLTVDSLALSPDGRGLAFIGLSERGQKDLYLIPAFDADGTRVIQLTDDVFAEREVSWGPRGIVFSSDATGHGRYNLFRIDPRDGSRAERLTDEPRDQFSPEMLPDGRVFFVAYDEAGANLYEARSAGQNPDGSAAIATLVRHSDVPTGLYDVSPGPDGGVWALHHQGHRRVPVRLTTRALLDQPVAASPPDSPSKAPERRSLSVDRAYDPLSLASWSPDGFFVLAGFSGDAVFGSLIVTASDRLRDHGLVLTSSVFGSFDLFDIDVTYVNQERRLIWGVSLFHDVGALIDDSFERSDDLTFVSYRRFFGARGVARYPFSQFLHLQGELALGGADYFVTDDTADVLADPSENVAGRDLLTPWQTSNDGLRVHAEAELSLGYSTIGYHRATGPIRGSSILLSERIGTEPWSGVTYHQLRLDTEHYLRVVGSANLVLRGALGITRGDQRAPQFYLSSFHTLRGVPFGDTDFLLGRMFFYSTVEFQFPIVTFAELPLIDLEGVLAADFGGVGDGVQGVWDRRVFDLVFGFNLGFAPLVLRIHFAQPIGIGSPLPNAGDLTFNLSLAWRYQ